MPSIHHLKPHTSWTRFATRKEPLRTVSAASMKGMAYTLRWALLLIVLFIGVGMTLVLTLSGTTYLAVMFGHCIIGFSTFFIGYSGLILAKGIIRIITGAKTLEPRACSYYFTKKHKHRF